MPYNKKPYVSYNQRRVLLTNFVLPLRSFKVTGSEESRKHFNTETDQQHKKSTLKIPNILLYFPFLSISAFFHILNFIYLMYMYTCCTYTDAYTHICVILKH